MVRTFNENKKLGSQIKIFRGGLNKSVELNMSFSVYPLQKSLNLVFFSPLNFLSSILSSE